MESREFETRCRVAAWAIAYWGRILLLMFAYGIVVHHEAPVGLLVILATEFVHRRVRKGERIGSILVLLVLLLLQFVGMLWTTLDRAGPDPAPKVRFLIGFAAANVVLVGIATVATWRAFAVAPRPAPPERTPAQVARHRQLGGLVLAAGLIGAIALFGWAITKWQETGRPSHPLKGVFAGAVLLWLVWLFARSVARGKGVAVATAVLLPALIGGVAGSAAMLAIFPAGSVKWTFGLVYLVVTSGALVVTMRAILGGERKGQGDAG